MNNEKAKIEKKSSRKQKQNQNQMRCMWAFRKTILNKPGRANGSRVVNIERKEILLSVILEKSVIWIVLKYFSCCLQRFQKCEYEKTKLFRTERRGWGLLADENIMAGQFIIECCGEVISFEEVKKRSQAYESHDLKDMYIIFVDGNDFIDSTWKGSFARFINHSCSPNCETSKWIVSGETRVGIIAKSTTMSGKMGMTDDESTPVIFGTSGGNEHTKILNDGEGSTFKLEPTNSATKKSQCKPKLKQLKTADPGWKYGKRASQTNKAAVECNFCKKVTNGGIFRHKQYLIGTCKNVSRCEQCPDVVREEIKKYVHVKKEQKHQALLQADVTNTSDDKYEDMEIGEATE
ncbi:hypothetical protein H5410_035471 [Solanum commersonii]|uniref:SET domain-containing protein n=1 Tax=Solanum commersonii TaxID=4109 RepID=A0A9J5Y2Z7_SOLCO|nr:hypothetical protein H5410_035471 [Solanum commersonii]